MLIKLLLNLCKRRSFCFKMPQECQIDEFAKERQQKVIKQIDQRKKQCIISTTNNS